MAEPKDEKKAGVGGTGPGVGPANDPRGGKDEAPTEEFNVPTGPQGGLLSPFASLPIPQYEQWISETVDPKAREAAKQRRESAEKQEKEDNEKRQKFAQEALKRMQDAPPAEQR